MNRTAAVELLRMCLKRVFRHWCEAHLSLEAARAGGNQASCKLLVTRLHVGQSLTEPLSRCLYPGNDPELRWDFLRGKYKFCITILCPTNPKGEVDMRQLTIAAAAIAIAAMISIPASADYLGGGPRKQNGQCWKGSKGSEGFGYWMPCPQPASSRTAGRRGQPGQPGQPGIDGETRSGGAASSN
jgi:hypothetical protein